MHKKDYAMLAEAIGKAWADLPPGPQVDSTVRRLIQEMGMTFKLDNGAFNRERFMEAVATHYLNNRKPYRKKRTDQ